jgi:hypothetical protein
VVYNEVPSTWNMTEAIHCNKTWKMMTTDNNNSQLGIDGYSICTKNTLKNPQLNCQPGVSKLRFVEKYMPKVEGLVVV